MSNLTPTDWRALCAELLEALENAIRVVYNEDGTKHISTADPTIAKADAALAQPEPQGPTDEALMAAARDAVDAYPRCSELPYFMSPDSDEYEPLLLALRAAARWGRPAIEPVPQQEAE